MHRFQLAPQYSHYRMFHWGSWERWQTFKCMKAVLSSPAMNKTYRPSTFGNEFENIELSSSNYVSVIDKNTKSARLTRQTEPWKLLSQQNEVFLTFSSKPKSSTVNLEKLQGEALIIPWWPFCFLFLGIFCTFFIYLRIKWCFVITIKKSSLNWLSSFCNFKSRTYEEYWTQVHSRSSYTF